MLLKNITVFNVGTVSRSIIEGCMGLLCRVVIDQDPGSIALMGYNNIFNISYVSCIAIPSVTNKRPSMLTV